jgi:hypothetical protein
MEVSSQLHGPAVLPSGKEASLSIGWADYRDDADAEEKRKYLLTLPDIEQDSSIMQSLSQSLYRLSYSSSCI